MWSSLGELTRTTSCRILWRSSFAAIFDRPTNCWALSSPSVRVGTVANAEQNQLFRYHP